MLDHFRAHGKIRKIVSERQVLDIALYKIGARNPSLCPVKIPSIDIDANDLRGPNESSNQPRSAPDIKRQLRSAKSSNQPLCHCRSSPMEYPFQGSGISYPVVEFTRHVVALYASSAVVGERDRVSAPFL